eukprot:3839417-Rhodomonas_salina.5
MRLPGRGGPPAPRHSQRVRSPAHPWHQLRSLEEQAKLLEEKRGELTWGWGWLGGAGWMRCCRMGWWSSLMGTPSFLRTPGCCCVFALLVAY